MTHKKTDMAKKMIKISHKGEIGHKIESIGAGGKVVHTKSHNWPSSHDKALGNVLKGKNIEGDKSRRAAKMLGISHKEHLDFKRKNNL